MNLPVEEGLILPEGLLSRQLMSLLEDIILFDLSSIPP
jgi:hypothetical protein